MVITNFLKLNNDYRFEHKFFISNLSEDEVESIIKLHPAFFSERFYKRSVNNIYLDSPNFKNYFDNVNGISERIKIRIRWYGNLFGIVKNPYLEIKIKNNNLGQKVLYSLSNFSLDKNFSIDTIYQIFQNSKIPEFLKSELKSLNFSILNSYKRKYFESENKDFRLTIDSNMKFYELLPKQNNFLFDYKDYLNIVLELKCNKDKEELISNITNYFPFRITKSSKYIFGVEKLIS